MFVSNQVTNPQMGIRKLKDTLYNIATFYQYLDNSASSDGNSSIATSLIRRIGHLGVSILMSKIFQRTQETQKKLHTILTLT